MELTPHEFRQLLSAAGASDFAVRDTTLVRAGFYWGFTATELSLLNVQTIMARDGGWQSKFKLPASFAFNNNARTAHLRDAVLLKALDAYVQYRIDNAWAVTESPQFRKLAPRQPLFLGNRGQPFAMTPRSPGASDLLPTGMNRLLRELLDAAGLEHHSPLVFRDTYIIRLWDKGLGKQEIMALTGIRKSETITRKISHRIPSVESVFESWYTEQWQ